MVTRVRMREILLAELFPYFVLGKGGMAASVALAVFLEAAAWSSSPLSFGRER